MGRHRPLGCKLPGTARSIRLTLVSAVILGSAADTAPAVAAGFDPLLSLCLASNPPTRPAELWSAWSLAPETVLPMLLMLVLYVGGLRAQAGLPAGMRVKDWQAACFVAGWLVLVIAVVSPLCRLAATLVSAHMVQHVLLVAVAPPLLALGAPGVAFFCALPERGRRIVRSWSRSGHAAWHWVRSLAIPVIYGAAIWFWHVPHFYQGALLNEAIHLLMYATLLTGGFLFWENVLWMLRHGGGGRAVVSLLLTLMHTGLLGALLTFAREPWYPLLSARASVWGLAPLADQQLAGLIMWVPMGMIYLIAGLGVMAVWLRAMDRPARERIV